MAGLEAEAGEGDVGFQGLSGEGMTPKRGRRYRNTETGPAGGKPAIAADIRATSSAEGVGS